MSIAVRPQTLDEYQGQSSIMPLVRAAIDTCNKTGKPWPSTLLFGPPGVGKTTLAKCICTGLEAYEFVSLTASKDMTPAILRKLLLDLDVRGYGPGGQWKPGAKKYMVFLDEVNELRLPAWESVLFNAIEDFEVYDERGTTYWLPDLSVVCSTNFPWSLPPAGLSRLTLQLHLEPYSPEELGLIVKRVYPTLTADLVKEVAKRSRGIARTALGYAEGVRDHGLKWFEVCRIDERGLNDLDRAYLRALEAAQGKGLSINSIANVVRESPKTLTAFVEPELLRLGLIEIQPHVGRILVNNTKGRGPKLHE